MTEGVRGCVLCVLLVVSLIPNGMVLAFEAKSGQLHSSPEHLKPIFLLDRLVGDGLKHLTVSHERIDRYLESHRWLVTDAAHYGGDTAHAAFIGNPLHVYALIKRMVLFWPPARDIFNKFIILKDGNTCRDKNDSCVSWKYEGRCLKEPKFMAQTCPESCGICIILEHLDKIRTAENETVLPSEEDLERAAQAIGRLQHIYNLPIGHLTRGRIYNNFSSVELDDWDCLRIAKSSFNVQKYVTAWEWYHHIRKKTKNLDLADHVQELLTNLTKVHDEKWKSTEDFFLNPLSEIPNQPPRVSPTFSLCRGETLRPMNDLKCELTTLGSPFFFLQPVKREVILNDPEMYIYHDIISEPEMETLKLLSQDQLEADDEKPRRSTWFSFLPQVRHSILDILNHRSSLLTGLITQADGPEGMNLDAEPIKIRSYGTGGYLGLHGDVRYKLHKDGCPEDETMLMTGDRMATLLFYLNDVEEGGRTAFPLLGVSVAPKKGSAVVWYNLKRNGDYNHLLNHVGCPVLLGRKWVCLKWIRENVNYLKRPCSLDPEK